MTFQERGNPVVNAKPDTNHSTNLAVLACV